MNKKQQAMKENLEKARQVYEAFYQEYYSNPNGPQWNDIFKKRVCAKIQLALLVSERKAKEYLKLVIMAKKFNGESKNT